MNIVSDFDMNHPLPAASRGCYTKIRFLALALPGKILLFLIALNKEVDT